MLNHKARANLRRATLGRGKFKSGQRVDASLEELQFESCQSLSQHEPDDEQDVLERRQVQLDHEYLISELERLEDDILYTSVAIDGNAEHLLPSLPGEPSDLSLRLHTTSDAPLRHVAVRISPQTHSMATGAASRLQPDFFSSSGLVEQTDEGFEGAFQPGAISEEDLEDEPFNVESISQYLQGNTTSEDNHEPVVLTSNADLDTAQTDTGTSSRIPGLLQWLRGNKHWVALFYKRSLKATVVDDILRIIDAPCKSWKTICANIASFSGLDKQIEVYKTCPRHFCFPKSTEDLTCPVCGPAEHSAPTAEPCLRALGKVCYIPIMSRIEAMIADSGRRKELYGYWEERRRDPGYFTDYFDGEAFRNLCELYGGEDNLRYDIFLGISTDGFQAFKNKSCDVWPVVAVLINLPPSVRYAAKNVIPLLFTEDGSQPKNLQSFLVPLIQEVNRSHENGGITVDFGESETRKVRIHIAWVSSDLDALMKIGGLCGHNAKVPCRFCLVEGVYAQAQRHYYYPSKLKDGRRTEVFFDLSHPTRRSVRETNLTFRQLEAAQSKSQRDRISKGSGISCRSVLFDLPSFVPFKSFPIDIMHLFYNVQNHLLSLHLCSDLNDVFVFSHIQIQELDVELLHFARGISGQIAPAPRELSKFKQWKAAEHKEVSLSYLLVLFDGYVSKEYLGGLKVFVDLVDLCYRPSLSLEDVERIGQLSRKFIEFYEERYVRYERSRVNLCKYVIHLLIHLEESVKYSGPLVCTNQFWVEKYIGWTTERCNARNKAGASMSKSAIFSEGYKIFYNERVHDDSAIHDSLTACGGYQFLGKISRIKLRGLDDEIQIRSLIADYLTRKFDGLHESVAKGAASRLSMCDRSSRIQFLSGSAVQSAVIHSTSSTTRPSCYIAVEMELSDQDIHVYYGKLLSLVRFDFGDTENEGRLRNHQFEVAVISWATDLKLGEQGQVYESGPLNIAFKQPTMEDVCIIRRLIGAVEHTVTLRKRVGNSRRSRLRKEKRVYFVDPSSLSDGLCAESSVCEDGVKRILQGFSG